MEGILVVVVVHLKGSLVVVVLNVLMSTSEQQHSGTAVLRRAITHTPVRQAPHPLSSHRGDAMVYCTGLYWFVLACTGLHWSVLACTVSSNTRYSEHVSSFLMRYHSLI